MRGMVEDVLALIERVVAPDLGDTLLGDDVDDVAVLE